MYLCHIMICQRVCTWEASVERFENTMMKLMNTKSRNAWYTLHIGLLLYSLLML